MASGFSNIADDVQPPRTYYGAVMTRYDKRIWLLAAALSALAGYVDAIGFIELGGFFVSFMSGNSTRLGVGLVETIAAAGLAASLVAGFVLGVIAGALIACRTRRHRGAIVLTFVTMLLAGAAALGEFGLQASAVLLMAAAMGAENAIFEREGEVSIGLTYMTGTLVKLGQRAAATLLGGAPWEWLPYLLLWIGLVAGVALGAAAYAAFGFQALWGAAAAAALFVPITGRLVRD
jgi:uncharacterized membrane protein YoaK (UPF0700 family)